MSETGTLLPSSRAARAAASHWGGQLLRLKSIPLVLSAMAAIAYQALRPLTWRRPVRDEFWRFMDVAGVQSLVAVAVLGSIIGVALLAQGLYWVERVGDRGALIAIMGTFVVREVAPLLVGLLVIGRGGLIMLSELDALYSHRDDRALDAMGLDPFLLFVVPRTVALSLSVFCLSIILVFLTFMTGYLTAIITGDAQATPLDFILRMYVVVGEAGYAILPVKTLLMGLAIGAVCTLTAVNRPLDHIRARAIVPLGFVRCVLAVVAVSTITSILL